MKPMTPTEFNTSIKIIENKLDLSLSAEQLAILKYNYRTPVLLNACAGAGKTTLLMISIILQIMEGRRGDKILAITFAKDAQLDMAKKFKTDLQKLGITLSTYPTFKTFDALFYQLLRLIHPDIRVFDHNSNHYWKVQWDMKQSIIHKPKIISQDDLIKNIMDFKEILINKQYSFDGLTLKNKSTNADNLQLIGESLNLPYAKDFYVNYLSVMQTYVNGKNQYQEVDFTDMKTQLYKALGNSKHAAIIKNFMHQYTQCFMDEFQDINSLQWTLMQKLLPPEAKEHLAVIGDDDQSIYTFRGSNPNLIMNFQNKIPNAKVMNLSTNYRTAGNVLTAVVPLIKQNQYRLDKHLLVSSNNLNTGHIYGFRGTQQHNGSKVMLNSLLQKLEQNECENKSIAVLCRNNIDIAIASDYLANHHQYVNVNNKTKILQNTPLYLSFLRIGHMLVYNDFHAFYEYSNKIGFSQYKMHIKHVLAKNHLTTTTYLTDYFKMAEKYDNRELDLNHRRDQEMYQHDIKVKAQYQKVQSQHAVISNGQILYNAINTLTNQYYNYMLTNHYEDENKYNIINDYFASNLINYTDLNTFFNHEEHKLIKLTTLIKDAEPGRIHFMTIHQSKGLEFNDVYLYNMRANGINNYKIWLNHKFAPNVKKETCLIHYLALDFEDIQVPQPDSWIIDFQTTLRKAIQKASRHYNYQDIIKDIANNDTQKFSKDLIQQFNQLYKTINSYSLLVEDERRLIYVALTRSINNAYLNIDNYDAYTNTSPLLDEITIDNDYDFSMTDDGTLVNTKTIYDKQGYTAQDIAEFYNKFRN